MIAMSDMSIVPRMHSACHQHPGSGMFVCLVWLLMRMLMGVSVIHVVLVCPGLIISSIRRGGCGADPISIAQETAQPIQ